MMGPRMFGQMWQSIIRHGPAPRARAAMAKSRSRTERACPRTSRAKAGVKTMPMATMALESPGPRLAAIARASTRVGNAQRVSTMRIRTSSTHPPQ